ncbi:MAG: low molecular weight protein arginine phosphatase [Gemmatimonadales bacterium]|nr:low molecular weight protein arginine phosphatase [Gemmatimonadales bacterium]
MNVLFVCSGNTCRSPMAEALLRRAVHERGWDDVTVGSAGTGALEGAPASEGSYLVSLEAGLDLSRHRARQLTPRLIRDADVILTMSRSHRSRVEGMGGEGKTHLLTRYAADEEGPIEVQDPFGAGLDVYRGTFDQLEMLVANVVRRLAQEREE